MIFKTSTLTMLIICIAFFSVLADAQYSNTQTTPEDTIYTYVEDMPEFPGGIGGMLEFISTHQSYPEAALKDKAEGRVMVRFVVTKEGEVTDPEVRIGVHPALDEEALRIIKSMPKFKPGTHEGKKVNVQFILPVEFELPEEAE